MVFIMFHSVSLLFIIISIMHYYYFISIHRLIIIMFSCLELSCTALHAHTSEWNRFDGVRI